MAAIGDTFLLVNARINEHCFVMISDPRKHPDRIVTVNFTSYDGKKDQSCIVERDEHPFVKHRTCIYYRNNLLSLANTTVFWPAAISFHMLRWIRPSCSEFWPARRCHRLFRWKIGRFSSNKA